MAIMKQTLREQLEHLQPEQLRDLIRNGNTSAEGRQVAIELLLEKKHPFVNHPEVAQFIATVAEPVVEAVEAMLPKVKEAVVDEAKARAHVGAPSASVTTATMFQSEVAVIDKKDSKTKSTPKSE